MQDQDDDIKLLLQLVGDKPEALSALRRIHKRDTEMALVAGSFANLAALEDSEVKTETLRIMRVVYQPVLERAKQVYEQLVQAGMHAAGLDPNDPKARDRYAQQLGSTIRVVR